MSFWVTLQKTLNIQDVGMMPMAAAAPAAQVSGFPMKYVTDKCVFSFYCIYLFKILIEVKKKTTH